jgi:hypothetical protein
MWLLGLYGSRDFMSMTDEPPKRRGDRNQRAKSIVSEMRKRLNEHRVHRQPSDFFRAHDSN